MLENVTSLSVIMQPEILNLITNTQYPISNQTIKLKNVLKYLKDWLFTGYW